MDFQWESVNKTQTLVKSGHFPSKRSVIPSILSFPKYTIVKNQKLCTLNIFNTQIAVQFQTQILYQLNLEKGNANVQLASLNSCPNNVVVQAVAAAQSDSMS